MTTLRMSLTIIAIVSVNGFEAATGADDDANLRIIRGKVRWTETRPIPPKRPVEEPYARGKSDAQSSSPSISIPTRAIEGVVVFVVKPPQDGRQESPETTRDRYAQQFEELNKLPLSELQGKPYRPELQFPAKAFHISDGQIQPHNLPILAGEPVVFVNRTRRQHLISLLPLSRTPRRGERTFLPLKPGAVGSIDPGLVGATQTGAHVRVTDLIDGWMHAHVLVFNHRFFAITDDAGTFEIVGVQPGKNELAIRDGDDFARIVSPKAREERFLQVDVDRRVNDVGTIDVFFEAF